MDKLLFVASLAGYDSYRRAWVRLAAFLPLCMPVTAEQEGLELVCSSHRPCVTRAKPTRTTRTSRISWGGSGELVAGDRDGRQDMKTDPALTICKFSSPYWETTEELIGGLCRSTSKLMSAKARIARYRAFLVLLTSSYYCVSVQRWI